MRELFVTSLDGSLIFIVWGSCLSHCSMDLSYLLYEGVVCHIACWICHIYCMGGVAWCLSHRLMDLLYLLYGGVVCHIARWICHIYCMGSCLSHCSIDLSYLLCGGSCLSHCLMDL